MSMARQDCAVSGQSSPAAEVDGVCGSGGAISTRRAGYRACARGPSASIHAGRRRGHALGKQLGIAKVGAANLPDDALFEHRVTAAQILEHLQRAVVDGGRARSLVANVVPSVRGNREHGIIPHRLKIRCRSRFPLFQTTPLPQHDNV